MISYSLVTPLPISYLPALHAPRKNTHIGRCLHVNSHHFPPQKNGVISTLVTRALGISDRTLRKKYRAFITMAKRKIFSTKWLEMPRNLITKRRRMMTIVY